MLRRRQREGVFENLIRFGEAFIDVTAIEPEVGAQVRPFDGFDLRQIGETGSRQLDRIMHQHRAGLERIVDVEHRR